MPRTSRQSKILELISQYEIETQDELVSELRKAQYNVTQATISRDIKELGLVKIMTDHKTYKYAREVSLDHNLSSKITNLFRESVISVDSVGNFVIVKTMTGNAKAAGMLIDKLNIPGTLGSVAGDDTILVIVKDEQRVSRVVEKLKEIIG